MFERTPPCGPPTHYSRSFDEHGQPGAGTLESLAEDVAGELPEGWTDLYWDWQPRGDPKGEWVYLAEKKAAADWTGTKAARAIEMDSGVTVKLSGGTVTVDSDEATANMLARKAARGGGHEIILADNSIALLGEGDLRILADAVDDHRSEKMLGSQQHRRGNRP